MASNVRFVDQISVSSYGDRTGTSVSSSYATSASYADTALSSSYATSASYTDTALTASYAVSASHEIIKEVSSSHADTASYVAAGNIDQPFVNITASGNISASGAYYGDGSNLTGISTGFWTGSNGTITRDSDVEVTGSLDVTQYLNLGKNLSSDGRITFYSDSGPSFELGVVSGTGNDTFTLQGSSGAQIQDFALDSKIQNFKIKGGGSINIEHGTTTGSYKGGGLHVNRQGTGNSNGTKGIFSTDATGPYIGNSSYGSTGTHGTFRIINGLSHNNDADSGSFTVSEFGDFINFNLPITASGNISSSATSTASFGTYLGDGSQLSGISTTPFPFTGSAIISGSTELIGPVNITGSTVIFSSGTPGLTIQSNNDPTEETKIYDAKIALEDSGLEQVVIKSNTSTNTMTGNISLRAATLAYGFLAAHNWHSNNRISWLSSGIRLGERLSDPDSSPNQTSPYVLSATGSIGFEGNTDITGSLEITGNVSGSATSTASFGTYLGDGSQLTGISTTPFPFTGDAVITGSLLISSSDGTIYTLSGSSPSMSFNDGQGLFGLDIINTVDSSTNTHGAKIKLTHVDEGATIYYNNGGGGGRYHDALNFISDTGFVFEANAITGNGPFFDFFSDGVSNDQSFRMFNTGGNPKGELRFYTNNGGSSNSMISLGQSTRGVYIRGGYSTNTLELGLTDYTSYSASMDATLTSINFYSPVTGSTFSGSFVGDGSQLTGVEAFPFSGSAVITGSLTVSGSLLNPGTVSIDDTDSPYTLTGTQQFVLIDPSGGNVTVNIPDAATYPGREIKLKLTQAAGANTVTLQRQGLDTIDGANTYTDLDIQYEAISIVSDGSTGWFIF
jgi:hypothetical protein